MKKTMVFGFLALAVGMTAQASVIEGNSRVMIAKTYLSKAKFSQPLTGFEECVGPNPALLNTDISSAERENPGTYPGYEAYDEAVREALSACRDDGSAECRVVSANYRDIISVEFIGYKACEALVVVDGYQGE